MVTGEQIKEARALLGWSESQLAAKSRISVLGIQRIEKHGTGEAIFVEALKKTLERSGVEFFTEDGKRGARLRRSA